MKSTTFLFLIFAIPLHVAFSSEPEAKQVKLRKLNLEIGKLEYKKGNTEFSKGNKAEAYLIYESACGKEAGEACAMLGKIELEKGDVNKALALLEKSCEFYSDLGCLILADEKVKNKDFNNALKASERACALNELVACHLQGVVLLKLDRQVQGRAVLKSACEKGYMKSCVSVGSLESVKGSEDYLKKACEKNYYLGCLMLGFNKMRSSNKIEAHLLFKKACEHSEPVHVDDFSKEMKLDSCHYYAIIENELGNKIRANELLSKNCKEGYAESCNILKRK